MDIVQYSIDIQEYDGMSEEDIANVLEDIGLVVYGVSWKARWTEEDYDNGKPPYSSD